MTREEAKNQLECIYTEVSTEEDREAIDMAIEALEEPKQGDWNVRYDTMYHFECPFCKYLHQYKDYFCPNCGARMKEGDEK